MLSASNKNLSSRKRRFDLGGVAVTDAYDLDTGYVIHAAAMPHYGDGRATTESIGEATRNTLEEADEVGYESHAVFVDWDPSLEESL